VDDDACSDRDLVLQLGHFNRALLGHFSRAPKRRLEAAGNPPLPQLPSQRVLAALPDRQSNVVVDLPDTVGLQVKERQFRMYRPPGRTEILKQACQRLLEFIEGYEAVRAGLQPPKRIEDEQRLMRSTFVASAPHIQMLELPDYRVGFSQRSIWLRLVSVADSHALFGLDCR
jgi:hypothetical protein